MDETPWVPSNFLALPEEQSRLSDSRVVVLPVPYDSTTSFKTGARDGPKAIIEASYNLEDYDPELERDVAQVGIYTAPGLEPHMEGPRFMVERVRDTVTHFLRQDKLVAILGGEHSVSTGHVQALVEYYPDLSVLYLDAHADLRDEYMGTGWGHASVARRISELCPMVQVGVRSLSVEEKEFAMTSGVNTLQWPSSGGTGIPQVFTDGGSLPSGQLDVSGIIGRLGRNVHVSVDLDVLDPAIMSAVGTPEPGGLDWHQITSLLRAVAEERRIVGFDMTELSPGLGPPACSYTAAKLVYKLVAYSTLLPGTGGGTEHLLKTKTGSES